MRVVVAQGSWLNHFIEGSGLESFLFLFTGILVYRQQEFFETRKELKRRRAEDVEVPEKVSNLGDCLQRITPLGESLDILGLRSLTATPKNANAEPASNSELAEVPPARHKSSEPLTSI